MTDFRFPAQASEDEILSGLRMRRAQAFVDSNPQPPDWKKKIKKLLPETGPVENGRDLVLVVIRDTGRDASHAVLALKASVLCTPEQCEAGNVFYPDASHNGCWGDHIPTIVRRILPEDIALEMAKRNLLYVPHNWILEFVTYEVSVGASR